MAHVIIIKPAFTTTQWADPAQLANLRSEAPYTTGRYKAAEGYVKRKTPSAGEAMVALVKHIPARVTRWIAVRADSRETEAGGGEKGEEG